MAKMSKKERLIATLKCREIDAIPISPLGMNRFEWANDFPAYRKVIDAVNQHGTPLVKVPIQNYPFMCDPADTRYKVEKKTEGDIETIKTTLQTPKGELYSISTRNPKVAGSSAESKFLIETDEDIEKMLSLKTCRTFLPDVSTVLAKQKEVGDEGLICVNGLRSPALVGAGGFKYEFFLMWAFTNEAALKELADCNNKRLETLIDYLLDKGAGPVFRWYNFEGYTTPMMPPSFADKFIAPYDEKLIARIHAAGGFIDNHCHGRLRDQVHNFLRIKADCINCVEPPPANDIDLRELKEKTGGKIAFWGYIQWEDVARKKEDEIRRLTREALEMSGNRGFILSQAASAYSAEISENFSNNMLAMIDEGVKYNQEVFG
jgi:hypothetical protein